MKKPLIEEVFAKAGGRAELRRSLGLSKQTMSDWAREGVVPIKHCPAVQRITGISLERLNPVFKSSARSPDNHPGERSTDKKAGA